MTSDTFTGSKPKAVRGPNGRFVSNKVPEPPLEEAPQDLHDQIDTIDSPEEVVSETQHIFFNDLSYYGEYIRRVYKNSEWFFVIEDLFPLANITEPNKVIDAFEHSPYYTDSIGTDLFEIEIPKNNLGQSHLTIGNKKTILAFIQLLRSMSHFFPGRFPEWIEETTHVDFAEADAKRKSILNQNLN